MLAAVIMERDDLRVEQVPFPEIGPGEVLLKVRSASICGTDLRILHGGAPQVPARHGAHPGARGGRRGGAQRRGRRGPGGGPARLRGPQHGLRPLPPVHHGQQQPLRQLPGHRRDHRRRLCRVRAPARRGRPAGQPDAHRRGRRPGRGGADRAVRLRAARAERAAHPAGRHRAGDGRRADRGDARQAGPPARRGARDGQRAQRRAPGARGAHGRRPGRQPRPRKIWPRCWPGRRTGAERM